MKPKNRIARFDLVGRSIFSPSHPPIPEAWADHPHFYIVQSEYVTEMSWVDSNFIHVVVFNLLSGLNTAWTSTAIRRGR